MTEALGAPELVLVRYGELALKGANRPQFEAQLCRNITAAVRTVGAVEIERRRGRIVVRPRARHEEVARRLASVFGIASVSPAWSTAMDPNAILDLTRRVLDDAKLDRAHAEPLSFRVRATRADKSFALTSQELERWLGGEILADTPGLAVDLIAPDVTLSVDVRTEAAYVFARRLAGPGGLPVGMLGRALALLSGGIDSPVAAWLAMKRGLEVGFVHFHSAPYVGDASRRKARGLAHALARWQPTTRFAVVPFERVQEAIRDAAPPSYRTLLYRRAMARIAERLAERFGYAALVTGDSLGQVASQTLENLACTSAAVRTPLLRPLVCFDKQDTIALARRIDTFELSNVDAPDCCALFADAKPVVNGSKDVCERVESEALLEPLLDAAARSVQVETIDGS